MLNGLNQSLSNDTKQIIFLDLVLFLVFVTFVNNYKLFFALITCILICYLTYILFNYIIKLSQITQTDSNDFQVKLSIFLFKNENIYKLIKNLFKINTFKNFFQNFTSLPNAAQTKLNKQENQNKQEDMENLQNEISVFLKKLSTRFIEPWYYSYISTNDQFLTETNAQLKLIFNDLINRFLKINKLNFFSSFVLIFNKNFFNIAVNHNLYKKEIQIENLHPAVRNGPSSEMAYIKKFVQIILRKSANNLHINQVFVEEFFVQIIGKNCVESLVNLLTKPNFLYFAICLLLSKTKTREEFGETKNEQNTDLSLLESIDEDELTIDDSMTSSQIDLIALNEKESISMKNPLYEESYGQKNNVEIINIEIVNTEINYEPKSTKEFTIYKIQVSKI